MQQRTYARQGAGNGRSNVLQKGGDPAQQASFAHVLNMGQAQAPNNLINAPTSLTNLAQLSGISLVPIGSRQPASNLSSSTIPVISFNDHQQPKITISANGRQQSATTITGEPAASSSPNTLTQYPPVYNLDTIPSIQLLNRLATSQRRGQRGPTSGPGDGIGNANKRQASESYLNQPTNLTADKKPRSHPQSMAGVAGSTHRGNRIQVLPVSENASLNLLTQSVRELQSSDNALLQANRPTSPTSIDSDNMSLMKLMAIFNNPALTITAVGPASNPAQSSQQDPSLWTNLNTSDQTSQKRTANKSRGLQQKIASNPYQQIGETSQVNQSPIKISNSPFPKSSASLQIFHAGSAKNSIDLPDDGGFVREEPSIQPARSGPKEEEPHTVTLSWSPRNASRTDNIGSSQAGSGFQTAATMDPARILQEFVAATESGERLSPPEEMNPDLLEPEPCILADRKLLLRPLSNLAKYKEPVLSVFSKVNAKKAHKQPIISTKRRLYVPRSDRLPKKKAKLASCLSEVEFEVTKEPEEILVSERHHMLSKMEEIAETVGQRRTETIEPDDIFVDRAKRFMSRIDMDMDRKRKRKFEKISQRSHGEDQDDLSEDSDYELKLAPAEPSFNSLTILPIQLPLEDKPDEAKKSFLSLVGLISRIDKNRMMIKQSEERLKNFSALNRCEDFIDENGDVQRIVNTLIRTGGGEMSMRTDTDIRRNELPFIEGLNRNTSRVKMTFMNALGLEKRSKRTTLYKVAKPQEVPAGSNQNSKARNDLNNKMQTLLSNFVKQQHMVNDIAPNPNGPITLSSHTSLDVASPKQIDGESIQATGGSAEIMRKAIRLAQASCREALHKAPNKDEYMKSLGLMAS